MFDRILTQTAVMSVADLEKLAGLIADQANAKREPIQGNRAFTFVQTYLDCGFSGHPVFMNSPFPTNEQAKQIGLDVNIFPTQGNSRQMGKLMSVVYNPGGAPCAWIKDLDGKTWSYHYDSNIYGWRADAD